MQLIVVLMALRILSGKKQRQIVLQCTKVATWVVCTSYQLVLGGS